MVRIGLLAAAVLMLFQAFFIFVPMQILGDAIGWPASLRFPAAEVLPLIYAKDGAMRLGYGLYLIWSLVFAVSVAVVASYAARGQTLGGLGVLAIGLGVASALARAIGIIRWPTGSAQLAQLYQAPGLQATDRAAIETVQTMLNAYGGGIGELVGVSLFGGMAIFALGILIMTRSGLPSFLGLLAIPVAVCAASPAVALLGLAPPISLVLTVTAVCIWFAVVGLVFLVMAVWSGRG